MRPVEKLIVNKNAIKTKFGNIFEKVGIYQNGWELFWEFQDLEWDFHGFGSNNTGLCYLSFELKNFNFQPMLGTVIHLDHFAVLLEMGNFPNYRDFLELLGKKNYGEFPIQIMGNFAISRFVIYLIVNYLSLTVKTIKNILFPFITLYLHHFVYLNHLSNETKWS